MTQYFLRPKLAADMADQLVNPGTLDVGLRSGLFLSGLRRTGKTTFLLKDLIPALEQLGTIVIYVDLWSDIQASPAMLVHGAIREALEDLQSPTSSILGELKRVKGADFGAFGFEFGFNLENVGQPGGPTLAHALKEVVIQAKTDVVLIIDEVQQAIASEEGNQLLMALKSARDLINQKEDIPGHFIFIGTGSHRAQVNELATRRNQAFVGATSVPYPVLGREYIEFVLNKLADERVAPLPSLECAIKAFKTLGNRPEEFIRAIRQLVNTSNTSNPDETFNVIAATLRSAAADLELSKVEQLGALAQTIFERIAATDGDVKGLFSAEAAADYSKVIGREVRVEEIQPAANELLAANIVMRRGHGLYAITDPFVQEIWREKISLTRDV